MLLVCSIHKKRDLSGSLTGIEDEDSILVWTCLLYLCLWNTKGIVYNHTGGCQAFLTWRSLKLSQQRHGSLIENVHLTRDLLQSAERRLKTIVLYGGEKWELSPRRSALSGCAYSNTAVRFIAVPKFDLFVSQHLWPTPQKAAYTCFHARRGRTIQAEGSRELILHQSWPHY